MTLVPDRRHISLRLSPLEISSDRRALFLAGCSASSTSAASSLIWPAGATISAGDLEKLDVLGSGNGGTVYKVRHKRTSETYALKMVNGDSDPTVSRQLLREMDILRRTDSPKVVRCHAIFQKPLGDVAILMEYMDGGSLEHLSRRPVSEKVIAGIARQVLTGLSYLHGLKIAHRDIKPANLLVNKNMEVKIADFGVSKIIARSLDTCNSYVGTCAYMSPEGFDSNTRGGDCDLFAGDIWSFGLTMLELCVGHFPLLPEGQRPDWATLMCSICFGDLPRLPEGASTEFRSFIECCLRKESSKRWTASQLLSHPFLQQEYP